jgi:hypothetical protein
VKLFEHICLGAITAGAAFLLVEGGLFFHFLARDADEIASSARLTIDRANVALDGAIAMESSIYEETRKVGAAADQQAAYWQKTQLQVYKLITDTKQIMVRTDRSLNDVLVPRLAASLDASTALQHTAAAGVTDTTAKIDDTLDALRPAIDNLVAATAAAAADMSDPAIHETLAHVDGVAGNLDTTSSDVQKYVRRMTAPARGSWHFIEWLLGLTYQARGALAK